MKTQTMNTQWTLEMLRAQQPQTIPVLIEGRVVEATIRKFEDQDETTIQIGDDYFGTTWHQILESLNANRPLEIVPNAEKSQISR